MDAVLQYPPGMMEDLLRWGGARMPARVAQGLTRALPWIGAAIAVLTVVESMKRKGVVRGGVHSALNALPVVGPMKNMAETVRGRDFIADRRRRAVTVRPR